MLYELFGLFVTESLYYWYYKVFVYMRCLILKLHGPNLKSAERIVRKNSINYNNALRPNIVWGALCG